MHRHNFEQFQQNTDIGLINDCIYYAWQNHQISDTEYFNLDSFMVILYLLSRRRSVSEYSNN